MAKGKVSTGVPQHIRNLKPPKLIQRACGIYRKTLWDVKNTYYPQPPGTPLLVEPYRRIRKRTAVAAMFGAKEDTRALLHQVLKCPALKAYCEGKPVKWRQHPSGFWCPAWTTTPASPVGMEARIWSNFKKSEKLEIFPRTVDRIFHVILWHEVLPPTATPKDMWYSLARMGERFAKYEAAMKGHVLGGFAMREVDRARKEKGVTVHMHVLYGVKGKGLSAAGDYAWAKSAEDDEITRVNVKRVAMADFNTVLMYVAGTRVVAGQRFAKILDGMVYVPWAKDSPHEKTGKARAHQWRAKGSTSAAQLHLILAGLAYVRQQPRWREAWDFRTRSGKVLRHVLQKLL